MWWAVDFLASEYGWSITDILERVYLDQLVKLIKQSNLRKIREWRMQLSIVSNPHVKDPKNIFRLLDREETRIMGPAGPEFDQVGFEALKNQLSRSQRIIVK